MIMSEQEVKYMGRLMGNPIQNLEMTEINMKNMEWPDWTLIQQKKEIEELKKEY